jgi:hypothetical protein
MQNTGCVINGGAHTHVYSNCADQQVVQIDALSAKVEELKLLVQELLQRKDSEPAPEPESEPESESEAEDIDVQDPDQPLTPAHEQLLLELKDISEARIRLKQSDAPKKAFSTLNKQKCNVHRKLYGHLPRPTSPEIINELISPPRTP